MVKQPRHRPTRVFENVEKVIFECDLITCPHCGQRLKARNTWHMRKTVQTMKGALIVGGKTRECANPDCSHTGEHYYASRALSISLPKSTYGLDVFTYIGWKHDHEHKQAEKPCWRGCSPIGNCPISVSYALGWGKGDHRSTAG